MPRRRIIISSLILLGVIGSASALYYFFAPQGQRISSLFQSGNIVDTWHKSSEAVGQIVDMEFVAQDNGEYGYNNQYSDSYLFQTVQYLPNCVLSDNKSLLCNGGRYSYDQDIISGLQKTIQKQTFHIQFIVARYLEDKKLPFDSRDKTQTIVSDKVYFVTDQQYNGGFSVQPNTLIVFVDRKPAIPFSNMLVKSTYNNTPIQAWGYVADQSPIEGMIQSSYDKETTTLSFGTLETLQGGNQGNQGIGTENIELILPMVKKEAMDAITNIKAAVRGTEAETHWSGSSLIIKNTQKISKGNSVNITVSYNYFGKKQELTFLYETIPDFSAKYQQEVNYDSSELSNRTTLTFSQAVSGGVLDSVLKSTKIPYQLNYREKNTASSVYTITRYTDPTKKTTIDLSAIQSIYNDKLAKPFIVEVQPYPLKEYQRYVSVVGSPIALVPLSSEYAYTTQVVAKNINDYSLWLRSCSLLTDSSKILSTLRNKPKKEYGSELLGAILNCEPSKKVSMSNKPFVRWKEYPKTFKFKEILGEGNHSVVEVGVKDFSQSPGTLVLTTDIGAYAHYSLKDNMLYVWTHSLKTAKPKTKLYYALYGVDEKNQALTITGRMESNSLKVPFKQGLSLGYLHLYEATQETKEVEVYDDLLGSTGTQTVQVQIIGDQTLMTLSPSYVQSDVYQRKNSFTTNESWINPQDRKIYAYTDRVLYKPGEKVHMAGWLRHFDGSFSKAPQGSVHVSIRDAQGQEIITKDMKLSDKFGGFGVDIELPDTANLGFYSLLFSYNGVEYYHTIQVKEFTKPMIFMNHKMDTNKGESFITLEPRYYFGAALSSYNRQTDYSMMPAGSFDDWSRCKKERCDTPITFAYQENYNSSGGMLKRENFNYPSITLRLPQEVTRPQQLTMTTTLTDRKTQETIYDFMSEQLFPAFIVGIKGWSHYRHNANTAYTLEGELRKQSDTKASADRKDNYKAQKNGTIALSLYKMEQSQDEIPSVDGEYYYENDIKYKLIASDTITVSDGKFSKSLAQLKENGQYKIELSYEGKYIAQQYITVYGGALTDDLWYGSLDNNNALTLSIPQKEYNPGDKLTVGLDPYIKGGRVLVLVEKDGKLLQEFEKVLENPTVDLTVQDSWFPNVHITVMQLVGQDNSKNISQKRSPEPRFFVGSNQVILSKRSRQLDIDIAIKNSSGVSQEYYTPRQEMQVSFDVHDRNKKGTASRISVAVVDKSLTDLYDEMKTPLERFYTWIEQGFRVITNYHLLFKALKVASDDGQKGGGAGGDGSVLNPRKEFLSTAYRNASVLTDKNGKANVKFKLPDNLTTWMVDIVAVGEKGQMGTQRAYFTSSQKYILTALMPQFVDPMTHIRIPVSLITHSQSGNMTQSDIRSQLKVYATLDNHRFPLQAAGDDERSYIDLDMTSIPMEYLLKAPLMTITLGIETDAIEYEVPIRLDTARRVSFMTAEGKEGNFKHVLSGLSGAQETLRISTLPTIDRDNQFRFMLWYPYGCAEQTISMLDSILLAEKLSRQGLVSTGIVQQQSGKLMMLTQEGRQDYTQIIRSALVQLSKYQKTDGLFGYWAESESNIDLSLYILSILKSIDQTKYPGVSAMQSSLNKGLKGKGTVSQQLYYQTILSQEGSIVTQQVDELANKKVSYQTDVLAFVAKAYQGEFDKNLWTRLSKVYEENPTLVSDGSIYTNTIPLQSMLIQSLLHLDRDTEALQLTRDITKRLDDRGGWGWSTHDTRWGLRAIADWYLENKINPLQQNMKVELTVNNKDITLQLLSGKAEYNYPISDGEDKVTIKRSNNTPLFVSSSHTWIERSTDRSPQKDNIRYLEYTQTGITTPLYDSIGSLNEHSFRFQTKTDASQVAVVATLPAYLRLMQSFNNTPDFGYNNYEGSYGYSKTNTMSQFLRFESANDAGVWYNCTPTHYEQRYDKLVLFYDKLPAGARCDISFMTSKTHDAAAQPALLTVYEMYDTRTFGETIYK